MFSKGLETFSSHLEIENGYKDSPVKVVEGNKFRLAVSYQLRNYTTTFSWKTFTLPLKMLNLFVTGITF